MKQSGIQKDVLALYRRILRASLAKDRAMMSETMNPKQPSFLSLLVGMTSNNNTITDGAETASTAPMIRLQQQQQQQSTVSYAVSEFRKQAMTVKRFDSKKIEYMIRKGEKQMKLLMMPGVVKVGGTAK